MVFMPSLIQINLIQPYEHCLSSTNIISRHRQHTHIEASGRYIVGNNKLPYNQLTKLSLKHLTHKIWSWNNPIPSTEMKIYYICVHFQ